MQGNETECYMHAQQDVVAQDSKLEEKADTSMLELAQHRWHWTVNPDNAERITAIAYAKMVGRNVSTIKKHTKAYGIHKEHPEYGFINCLERAHWSEERAMVVEQVSETFERSWATVRTQDRHLVDEVVTQARSISERDNVDFAVAVKRSVELVKAHHDRRKEEKKVLQENHGVRFVSMENELVRAHNSLYKALVEAQQTDLTDQERNMLQESIRRVSSIAQLLDYAVTGTVDVDWDNELAKLSRGVA